MPRPRHDPHPENAPVRDDDLVRLEAEGPWPLPPAVDEGFVEHDGARIWTAIYGAGPAVVLLHGGLGNAGNWGYQVAALSATPDRFDALVAAVTRVQRPEVFDGAVAAFVARVSG